MRMLDLVRGRWACLLLLVVTVLDLIVIDPLPFIDEAILATLTAACFRRHRKTRGEEAASRTIDVEADVRGG